jgi:hypothetical protein
MAKVRRRKQAMIEREIAFHLNAYKTSGAELIMGSGRFVAPKTLEVTLNDGGTLRQPRDDHRARPSTDGPGRSRCRG